MVIDLETTGLDPATSRVIEVATVAITGGTIGDTWSSLIDPGRPIPVDASAVHGITDAMVAGAPGAAAVAADFRGRCGDRVLVFHHAPFDLPFIAGWLRAAGQAPLHNPIVDTLGLARGFPDPAGQSLGALTERLRLHREARHRALGDALTTARLLLALAPRWEAERGIRSLMELAAISQDALRQSRPAPRVPAPPPEPAPLPLFEGLEAPPDRAQT